MTGRLPRTQVFVSYSHRDSQWLERLRVHLRPLEREHTIQIWDDTKIAPGASWREEIERAVEAAKVAVLLVSADFLASDFIAGEELPPLLSAAREEGAVILPVILSPSRFMKTKGLAHLQCVNSPSAPLIDMTRGEQEAVFVKVAECIEAALDLPSERVGEPAAAPARAEESAGKKAPAASLKALPTQLPPLVGREAEVAALEQLLRQEDVRLVTLTGPGGIGKTRLGLEVASRLLPEFEEGVLFTPLESISDPALVTSEIAQSLGLGEAAGKPFKESLKEYLKEKHVLLLLDNFEQVIPAAPLLSELCAACLSAKALVTSRALLHLSGEHEFPLSPMPVPDPGRLPQPDALLQNPAVALFVQRAQAAKPGFRLTPENAGAVVNICRRLDGLPLAIELAAARVKLLSPESMLARLESSLKLLTGGAKDLPARRQTMRGAIEWSYELLDEGEKRLFRRLSVFVGGFTLEAAEAVCDAAGDLNFDVLDGVSSLLDKNLLRQGEDTEDEPRFNMLQTIREFALQCSETSGGADALRDAHAAYFLSLVESVEPDLRGARQAARLKQLRRELDNLRATLRHLKEGGRAAEGLRMAAALMRFWKVCGYLSEGREWLEEFLSLAEGSGGEAAARAKAYSAAAFLNRGLGKYAQAKTLLERGLALYESLRDERGMAYALNMLGLVAYDLNDDEGAVETLERSRALYVKLGDRQGIADALNRLSYVAQRQGDYERAVGLQEESIKIRRGLSDEAALASSLNNLGVILLDQCEYERSALLIEESLSLFRDLGDRLGIACSLTNLGDIAQGRGDYEQAKLLYEESLEIFTDVGDRQEVAARLVNIGDVERLLQDYERAETRYGESLALQREMGAKSNVAPALEGLALVEEARGRTERALQLFGAAASLRKSTGIQLPPARRVEYEEGLRRMRAAVGDECYTAALAAGGSMSLENVLAGHVSESLSACEKGAGSSD
jgi:predicted ATPase